MKENYHFCLSSHNEVMFRSETDLIIGFNYLAVAALETDSTLLADGFDASIYLLPEGKRLELGNSIWKESQAVRFRKCESPFSEKIITEDQIRRCLAL